MFEFLQESVYENDMIFIENGISTIEDCMYAYESAETDEDLMIIQESMGSAIESVFERIKDAYKKIIEAFRGLFNKEKNDKLAKKIKENPEAAKQKVKVPDQKKLNKLYDDAVKKVENGEDPEEVDSWFKKHAKGVLVTSVISISIGALFLAREKHYKEALSKAEQRGNDIEKLYKQAKHGEEKFKRVAKDRRDTIKQLREENNNSNEKLKNTTDELNNTKKDLEKLERRFDYRGSLLEDEYENTSYYKKGKRAFKGKSERMMKRLAIAKSKQPKTDHVKKSQGLVRVTNSFKEFSKRVYTYNGQIIADTVKGPNNRSLTFKGNHMNTTKESVDSFDEYLENAYEEFSTEYDYDDYLDF